MGVSDEAKNVIPLKFLRKIKNNVFFPLVNSIRGHTVCINKFIYLKKVDTKYICNFSNHVFCFVVSALL
jgi:hypothetical protein